VSSPAFLVFPALALKRAKGNPPRPLLPLPRPLPLKNLAKSILTPNSIGHRDVTNALIKAGANVNATDNDGVTALMNGSNGGHT
jgi:ankyrin repeat protein